MDQTTSPSSSRDRSEQELKYVGFQFKHDEAANRSRVLHEVDLIDEPCDQLAESFHSLSTKDSREDVDRRSAEPCTESSGFGQDEVETLINETIEYRSQPDRPSPSPTHQLSHLEVLSSLKQPLGFSAQQSTQDGFNSQSHLESRASGNPVPQEFLELPETRSDFEDGLQQRESMYQFSAKKPNVKDSGYETQSHDNAGGNTPAESSRAKDEAHYHGFDTALVDPSQRYDVVPYKEEEVTQADTPHREDDSARYQEGVSGHSTRNFYVGRYGTELTAEMSAFRSPFYGLPHQQVDNTMDSSHLSHTAPYLHQHGRPAGSKYTQLVPNDQQGFATTNSFNSLGGFLYPNVAHPGSLGSPSSPLETAEMSKFRGRDEGGAQQQNVPQMHRDDGQHCYQHQEGVNTRTGNQNSYSAAPIRRWNVQAGSCHGLDESMLESSTQSKLHESSSMVSPAHNRGVAHSGSITSSLEIGRQSESTPSQSKGKERASDSNLDTALWICGIDQCKSSFPSEHELHSHQRKHIHREKRPYKCEHCKQNFLYPKDLRRHEQAKSHRNTAPVGVQKFQEWPCQYCGKTFWRTDLRKRHEINSCPRKFSRNEAF